jgi:TrmH family RNA methyltransferase
VILVRTRNPLNLGAAARAMSNFGFLKMRVVEPYDVAFRAARSAVGGAPVLAAAKEFPTLAAAVADCAFVVGTTAIRHRAPQQTIYPLADAMTLIRRRLRLDKVALLFGNEKSGLSNEDLAHCHALLHIPTRERNLSMNLGQAVAVCLYELSRQLSRTVGTTKSGAKARLLKSKVIEEARPATSGEVERLTAAIFDTLQRTGYVKSSTEPSVEANLRRMLRRQKLTIADTQTWLGMIRQIRWKLRNP